jgi:hypothetical protein
VLLAVPFLAGDLVIVEVRGRDYWLRGVVWVVVALDVGNSWDEVGEEEAANSPVEGHKIVQRYFS